MVGRKKIRTRGKISLSKYFQELKKGDFVSIKREPSLSSKFPKKFQGRTGIVEEKRGGAYLINVLDQTRQKKFLIHPIHLKKIKQTNIKDDKIKRTT